MPNWCYNTATFTNEDITKVDALEKFLDELDEKKEDSLFSFFRPRPEEKKDEWYDWNVTNWGCKWDASVHGYERTSDDQITVTFDTPWAPPNVLYEYLARETDWYPAAYYLEEGMAFVGYVDGEEDDYYEYTDAASLNSIPEHIVEHWNLREQLEEQEEDEEFDEEGVELTLDPEFDARLQELKDEFDALMMPTEKTLLFDDEEAKKWLKDLLRESAITVTFTKKDGSERAMYCTLLENKIPAEKTPKGTGKKENSESLAVFDLEKEEWRSFRWDSVKKIEFGLGEKQK
jgi:hypothetical protein